MSTINYLTVRNTVMRDVNMLYSTLTGSTITVSSLNVVSNSVALGASTSQSYRNFSGGSYTNGWGSTLTGQTAITDVTMSQNGQYQIAVQNGSSTIRTSANSGVTWSSLTGANGLPAGALAYPHATAAGTPNYTSVSVSANGQYQLASVRGGLLYVCANGLSSTPTFTAVGMGTPTVYMPFENSTTDVMSGTTVSVTGTPGYVAGIVGSATLSAVNLANTAGSTPSNFIRGSWTGSANFSASFWFNLQSLGAIQTLFSAYGTALYLFVSAANVLTWNFPSGGGTSGTSITGPTLSQNTWYNVTIIFQTGGACSLYLNNTLIGSTTNVSGVGSRTTTFFALGTYDVSAYGQALNGYIDDFRFYTSAVAFSPIVPMNWTQTAVSATGQYMLAASNSGLFQSSNYGATWTQVNTVLNGSVYNSLALSASGQYALATTSATTVSPNMTGLTSSGTALTTAPWTTNGVTWVASASSTYGSPFPVSYLFNNTQALNNLWASGGNTYSTAGNSSGFSTTIQGITSAAAGDWIQLQSSVPLVMSSYQFGTGGSVVQLPKTYYIAGSNDGNTWFPIQYGAGAAVTTTAAYTLVPGTILVNSASVQTFGSSTITTTTYSTTTNAYLYFRLIGLSNYNASAAYLEIGEWYINFVGGHAYTSNYGQTWTNTANTVFNDSAAISGNGQYVIGINNQLLPFSQFSFEGNATDSRGGLTAATGATGSGPVTYPGTIFKTGTNAAYFTNTPGATTGLTYLNYTLPASLQAPTTLTMSCWMYPTALPTSGWAAPIGFNGGSGGAFGTNFGITTTGTIISQFYTAGGGTYVYSRAAVSINTWTHLAIVFSNRIGYLYVNGVLQGGIESNTTLNAYGGGIMTNLYIGCDTSEWGGFAGYVDDVRIYTTALTPDLIALLYNSPSQLGTAYVGSNYLTGLTSYTLATLSSITNSITHASCSSTGQYMVLVTAGTTNNVFYSTNYGVSWTGLTVGSAAMISCTMSADGSYLTVCSNTTVYTLNRNSQGFTVAVGNQAGAVNQALNSIAIGNQAGTVNQSANSIILNASGSAVNSYSQGFYVAPIAQAITSTVPTFPLLGYGSDNQVVQAAHSFSNSQSVVYGEWIEYQLATPTVITSYTLLGRPQAAARYPVSWIIAGSNDDSLWTLLDTETGVAGWGTYSLKAATAAYTYYRIIFTQITSSLMVNISGWILNSGGNPLFTAPPSTSSLSPYSLSGPNNNILSLNSVVVCTVTWSWSSSVSSFGIINDGLSYLPSEYHCAFAFDGAVTDSVGKVAAPTILGTPVYNTVIKKVGTSCLDTTANSGGAPAFQLGYSFPLNTANGFSISFWMNTSNVSGAQQICQSTGSATTFGFELGIGHNNSTTYYLWAGVSGIGSFQTANSVFTYGVWYYITVTLSGSAGTIWSNGVSVASSSSGWGAPFSYSYFSIAGTHNGAYSFKGYLDDFRIYNRILTAADMAALQINPYYYPGMIAVPNMAANTTFNGQTGYAYLGVLMQPTGSGYNSAYNAVQGTSTALTTTALGDTNLSGSLILSSSSQVGIGSTNPQYALDVVGAAKLNGAVPVVGQPDSVSLPQSAYATFGQQWSIVSALSTSVAWNGCGISATGQYQTVIVNGANSGNNIYYSSNYGTSWALATGFLANAGYYQCGISGSGQYQLVGINSPSTALYVSSNYGQTWSATSYTISGTSYGRSSCLSYNGQYQFNVQAGSGAGRITMSSNYGVTFANTSAPGKDWYGVCCSSSGQYVSACSVGGYIWYSTDYGTTWTQSSSISASWISICCSTSGQYQMTVINGSGSIHYSNNYGVHWTQSNAPAVNWGSISCSSSGQYVIATANGGSMYYSVNYGVTWTQSVSITTSWQACALSQNGLYAIAVVSSGAVYSSQIANVSLVTNGRIGVGTTAPLARLTIRNRYDEGDTAGLCLDASDINIYNMRLSSFTPAGSQVSYRFGVNNLSSSSPNALVLGYNGNVGIGTSTPGYLLDVNGTLNVRGSFTVNGTVVATGTGSVWTVGASNLITYSAGNVSLSRNRLIFSNGVNDFNHSIYNNGSNPDAEGGWDGMKFNIYAGAWFRVGNSNPPTVPTTAMFINASGQMGIGMTTPSSWLDIKDGYTRSGTHGTGRSLYVTYQGAAYSDGIAEFRHTNGSQGIGIGYSGLYSTGYNTNQDFDIIAKGTGMINLRSNIYCTGNVGIGTATPGNVLTVYSGNGASIYNRSSNPSHPGCYNEWRDYNATGRFIIGCDGNGLAGLELGAGIIGTWTANSVIFLTNAAERMRINSSGYVGIGTTAPGSLLTIGSGSVSSFSGASAVSLNTSTGNAYFSANDGTRQMFMGVDSSGYGMVGTFSNHDFVIRTGNAERIRITTGGNMGIGTSPGSKLDIYSTATNQFALNITVAGETYALSSSAKNQYFVAGTVASFNTTYQASVNYACLIDLLAYSGNGATNLYFGAVPGTVGGGPANFVIGRRTGVTSWAESFRIDTNGYVGIGNTLPLGPLAVGNSAIANSDGFIVQGKNIGGGGSRHNRMGFDSNFNFVLVGDYGHSNTVSTWNPQVYCAWNSPANSLVIAASGNVGINTSAPITKFNVVGGESVFNGNVYLNSNANTVTPNPATYWGVGVRLAAEDNGWTGSDFNVYVSWQGGGWYRGFRFDNTGRAYNYNNSWGGLSDINMKENIINARNYLSDLRALRVVKYSLKADKLSVPNQLGLIAQEVEAIFPSLVSEDIDGLKYLKTSIIGMMQLKSIQELADKNDALEAKNAELTQKLERLLAWAQTQGFS